MSLQLFDKMDPTTSKSLIGHGVFVWAAGLVSLSSSRSLALPLTDAYSHRVRTVWWSVSIIFFFLFFPFLFFVSVR
jgi:hypothetical protein